ncbi:MAG: ABC transporter ATP-binding protein [Gemmataceae bacterium]|nr:ABC transporter ATP-binding protein [Gemmataceae bacterium]
MAAVIATHDLKKNYRRIEALRGVSLVVETGEIYGLLGQNGAGKTTLIKILLGITRGWRGQAELLGHTAGTVAMRRRVGYLPEDHHFPDYHTAFSLLDFYGQLLDLSRAQRRQRIPLELERVGLVPRMHTKIRGYSKGMKQRLGIAQALLHDPDVIFLDEPTDGVDPVGRREIRNILLDLKGQGCTLFLNSHLLSEVELICDRVGILQKGRMIREGDIKSLTQQKGRFLIGLAQGQQMPLADLQSRGYQIAPLGERWEVQLEEQQNIDPVVDLLRAQGLSIRHLVEKRQSLEDMFVETVQEGNKGRT